MRPRRERVTAGSQLLEAFASAYPEAFFVEIGANDGEHEDHLAGLGGTGAWRGLLVEPVPHVFARLQTNLGGDERFVLENAAVADRDGELPFFHAPDTGELKFADLLGSFSRDTIRSHSEHFDEIVETVVPTLTFASLCARHGVERLDLLVTDAEGHDWEILRQVDLARHAPRVVVYEHFHLSPADRAACRAHIEANGYATLEEGLDTFCLDTAPDDALTARWRRLEPTLPGLSRHDPPPTAPAARRQINTRGRSLRQHAARGTIVNSSFQVLLAALALARGVVLATLLSREDYGIWGILGVSLGTLMYLKQVGIGDKFVQQDEDDQDAAFQRAFTLEAMATGIMMAILLCALPIYAAVYDQWRIVLPGLALILVLPAGVIQAPLWIYYRNMQFARQRLLQAIDPVIGFGVAVVLAAAGAGYWSLVAGVFVGGWCTALVTLLVSRVRLRFRYDRGTLRQYAAFSWPLLVSSGASLVLAQAAVIAGNAELGLAGIGVLALNAQFATFSFQVDAIVTTTLYPAICAVRSQVELLREAFVKSNRLAVLFGLPFGIGLTLFASDLVSYVIGEQWRPGVPLFQVTGIAAAIGQIAFNWDAFMRAVERTRPMAVAGVVAMATFLLCGLPLLFAYGYRGMAYGIALQTFAHLGCRIFFLRRLFGDATFVRTILRAVLPTVPAAGLVLAVRALEMGERTGSTAAGELAVYLLTAGIATWLIEGRLVREMAGYLLARRPLSSSP